MRISALRVIRARKSVLFHAIIQKTKTDEDGEIKTVCACVCVKIKINQKKKNTCEEAGGEEEKITYSSG